METVFSITCSDTKCTANFEQEHFDYLRTLLDSECNILAQELFAGLLWSVTGDSDYLLKEEEY